MMVRIVWSNRQYEAEEYISSEVGGRSCFFEISTDKLGEGGNAVVYRCYDRNSGEDFAIKIQMNTRKSFRFLKEVAVLKNSSHPQLMSCVASGELALKGYCHKCPYVIMPLAERNLGEYYRTLSAPLPIEQLLGHFRGLSEALAVLHRSAIHRDIKPENILIKGESWILSDFGLCKFTDQKEDGVDITGARERLGPKYWFSPEEMDRVLGLSVDISKASDVFQLASVFWYVATKHHPTGILTEDDWTGPSSVFKVLESALMYDVRLRPQDGAEFSRQIDRAILEET